MKPFTYYHSMPRPGRVHVAGSVPNDEYRRNNELKLAEITYRREVKNAIIASHRWFSHSCYRYMSPQHNAFDRLAVAIEGLSNYQIDSIESIDTKDPEQFGMAFRCSKVVSPERTAHFLVRVGIFKDTVILSPAYKDFFPFVPAQRLSQDHQSHPLNELQDLLKALGASITYSSLYEEYEYYVTPEGFIYHFAVLNPVG